MILLPSKFSENFETGDECSGECAIDSEESKDCSDTTFSSHDDNVRLEYVQVFSPTVFETVEVYTSSDHSTNVSEFIENAVTSSENEATVMSPGLNLDLQTLEPGTYTLDVFETADFNFDTVFADQKFNSDAIEVVHSVATLENLQSCVKPSNSSDKHISELFKIRNRKNNSSHKTPSPKYSPRPAANARQFLNNFSHDLQKSEEKVSDTNLSWLLDFKVSSIFNPVETEVDNADEKIKRKLNDSQKKPRYTYTELIEQALKENGELTVSGIYSWISSRYPYYQQHDDRWKNSVRHNLSINPQFRKGKKASQGAGHFWNISESIVAQNSEPHISRTNNSLLRLNVEQSTSERVETNSNTESMAASVTELMNQIDDEVLAGTKSIQESETMSFIDVSLHEAAEQYLRHENLSQLSHINTTRNDIEQLWESTTETSDQQYGSLSPLIRELTEDSGRMDEENFLIEDIHNSICLGDELFAEELYSPYYGLTTI